ncbi:MAG: hypothetical protein OXU23_26255 [Candidatus Poribacteria bacterium]|nr:hypothetical protein [Candidatus Poribacteria bacterium]MDE0317430.1 hypothetical protein [Candidatus Poribacteria bacterium]
MKYGILFSMLIVPVFLLTSVGHGADFEIALEAELANVLQEPMVIADDELASDGKYVWMEGAPLTGGGDKGWVEFIINIPESGKYALWGHVFAWDGNSDSFWVTWQPADPNENAQVTKNTEYRWSIGTKNIWHWDRINHWLDAGTFDREWKFDKAGETILRIAVREDATKLDAIFVTSKTGAAAAGQANVRLPTDEDRKRQVEGLAVDAKGKVTTTWGSLKKAYK